MSAQFIENEGIPQFAVIPIAEYNALLEKAELLDDTAAYDRAMADSDEEIPSDVAKRLVTEHPLKVWREYRRLTQGDLANASGVSQAQIAMLETGKRQGTVDVWKELTGALAVDLDDLL